MGARRPQLARAGLLLLFTVIPWGCSFHRDAIPAPPGTVVAGTPVKSVAPPVVLPPPPPVLSDWDKRWWLEKTARLLRGGNGLTDQDDENALLKLSETQVVQKFMEDPRFGDAVFDFNTYFLGFKSDTVKNQGQYDIMAIEMSNALLSAQEALRGGDYFKLFDLTGPVLVAPLNSPRKAAGETQLTDAQARQKHAADLRSLLEAGISAAALANATAADVCTKLGDYRGAFQTVLSDGYPLKLFYQGIYLNPDLGLKLQLTCDAPANADVKALAATLTALVQRTDAFFTEMWKFEGATYHVKDVRDFRAIDLKAAGFGDSWLSFSFDQATSLVNSSTNMDRKRSAYILKQFFCDDLTPLGFETPQDHTGGEHGSDTSCYACHYKLDPMAGFFRDYGITFANFASANFLYFDDGAQLAKPQYQTAWKAPAGAGRDWNVGFIRSAGATAQNAYGSTVQDLSKIIRNAPEAKQCLVRRLFEYLVADGQTVDAGYLHFLSDRLTKDAAVNPTLALQNAVTAIVTSNAYHQRNLDPNQCYDYAPGTNLANSPPCRVAYLIQQNCASCHSSPAIPGTNGGLDLTQWVGIGGTMTFPHLDAQGKPVSAHDTFSSIVDRLMSTDANQRMPYKKVMSDQDRQTLFTWAQQTLNTLPGGTAP